MLSNNIIIYCTACILLLLLRAYRVVDIMAALITLSSTWRAASTPAVAPTLVLVHGLDSSRFTWNPFLSYCDICSWNTIALDLRGHGESRLGDAATFTAEAVAADIHHTLHKHALVTFPVVLVGHSMGGRVAMQYTDLFPEDLAAVVIEDMDITPRQGPAPTDEDWVARRAFSRAFPTWAAAKSELAAWYGEDRIDGWREDGRVFEKEDGTWWSGINPWAQQLARDEILSGKVSHAVWERAGRHCKERKIPLHVFVARDKGDFYACNPDSLREMQACVENAVITEFPNGSHSIHNTALEAFSAKVIEIIMQHQANLEQRAESF